MRRSSRRHKKKGLVFLLLTLSLALFALILTGTGYFDVKEIVVEGNYFVDKEKIIDISGISKGVNIFTVRVKEIKNDLESHPYIIDAEAKRVLPAKIVVNICERDMIGYIPFMGSYLLLDAEGKVVNASSDLPIQSIPVFKGIEVKDFKVEEIIKIGNPEIFDKMVYISNNILKHLSKYVPVQVDAVDLEDIKISLSNRFLLKVGGLNNLDYKLKYGDTILKDLYDNGVTGELYLNNGEKAFFRPWYNREEQ